MDSRRLLVLFVFLLALIPAQSSSAWNPYTQKYICDTVVGIVWGNETVEECLRNLSVETQRSFCESLSDTRRLECLIQENALHPAEIPAVMFRESDIPMKQENCPIKTKSEHKYLCENETTAVDRADEWFAQAEEPVGSECKRVYYFCIGAAYIAEAYNPFNWVRNDDPDCNKNLAEGADQGIEEGGMWSVSQVCNFDYNRQLTGRTKSVKYRQQFGASSDTIETIIRNLTVKAVEIQAMQLTTTTTTIKVTTTTVPVVASTTTTTTSTTTTAPKKPEKVVEEEDSRFSWIMMLILFVMAIGLLYALYAVSGVKSASKLEETRPGGRPKRREVKSLGDMGLREELPGRSGLSSLTAPGVKKKKSVSIVEEYEEEPEPHVRRKDKVKPKKESSIIHKKKGSKLGEAGEKKE
jgi:hypothetical protein